MKREAKPYTGPPLFHVYYKAATAHENSPLDVNLGDPSERLTIAAPPGQVRRWFEVLSVPALTVLFTIIQHGFTPGKRIEIYGSMLDWLKEHGVPAYQARTGYAELQDKHYLRREDVPKSDTHPKTQVVIVQSGVVEHIDDPVGVARTDGRRRKTKDTGENTESTETSGGDVLRFPTFDTTPVDNTVLRKPENTPAPKSGLPETEEPFAQVSPTFREPENTLSTGATSSSFKEVRSHYFFDSTSVRRALPRHDYTRFFTQPGVREALTGPSWELNVALLARCFLPRSTRCAEILEWFGLPKTGEPSTALAVWVRDLLSAEGIDRSEVIAEQERFLASFPVHHQPLNPNDFITALVVTTICTLDSKKRVDSYAGWFHTFLARDTWNVSTTLKLVLQHLTQTISDNDPETESGNRPSVTTASASKPVGADNEATRTPPPVLADTHVSSPTALPTTQHTTSPATPDEQVTVASNDDVDWQQRLIEAIEGTDHDTPEGFDLLLGDRKKAGYLIARFELRRTRERNQASSNDQTA